jgi:hypothetical protein
MTVRRRWRRVNAFMKVAYEEAVKNLESNEGESVK